MTRTDTPVCLAAGRGGARTALSSSRLAVSCPTMHVCTKGGGEIPTPPIRTGSLRLRHITEREKARLGVS